MTASITPTLNVAFDYQNGNVSLDAADTNLDIGFELTLPNFTATMSLNGLLFTHAVDAGTDFKGDIKFSLGSDSSVDFSGTAHIALGLTVSFVDPSLHASFNPTFNTTLKIDWGFDTQSGQLMTPQIQLQDFSLDADSFLHNFLGDIVTTVQKYTKPLQPFLNTFDTPVPIASAFGSSETIGDLILQGAGLSQDQQDRFNLMVKVIKAANSIDLSGSTGGAKIDFGTINITGNAEQAHLFNFDTSQISSVINEIFNSPVLQDVQNDLQDVADYAGLTSTAGFQFPLLENPGPVLGGILTGQLENMFSFSTGREHFDLQASVGFGIPDLLGIFLSGGMVFDADFTMGYDTAGLTKFIQDQNPADLLHGFYFDNSVDTTDQPVPNVPDPRKTALYLSGFMELSGSLIATLSGGLYGNIAMELASTDNSDHVHLDEMINNLSSPAKVFKFSGKLYASAQIGITLDTEVGPNITLFSYSLGEYDILNYDPPPPPSEKGIPIVVIDTTDSHSVLLDASKMTANADISVQPFEDLSVLEGSQTITADGIRVDYPTEIDLYVERKNDTTTNYYNFIGLDGGVPDGVQVNITDPFHVFADAGVPDPTPAQTKDAILLAGGSSVLYNYTEDADGGSHPNVVLIGGYGSNTLTGGTAEFGNFVPGDRIDQAKEEFGADISGFDLQARGFIGNAVDGTAMPAAPDGIIGATMTASRGGLMVGGPGDNSFVAAGPGAYEMDGNSWIDSFTISPSFNGVPATYLIDGGPNGQNTLSVHVPEGENVTFEDSDTPDKYDPSLKALAIEANAGLSVTAHGLTNVGIVSDAGSTVTLGDTSELNINFTMVGAAIVTYGGTNASDIFTVSFDYNFYGTEGRRFVDQLVDLSGNSPNLATALAQGDIRDLLPGPTVDNGNGPVLALPIQPDVVNGAVYTITRTFGTNGKVQTMQFRINDPLNTVITLNAGGAADVYNINLGLGSFDDIHVQDSDFSTHNTVNVNFHSPILLPDTATITDDSLQLSYYTPIMHFFGGLSDFYTPSVHYMPTVFFGPNDNLVFNSARPFKNTVINRPDAAGQLVNIGVDAQFDPYTPPGVLGWNTIYNPSNLTYQVVNYPNDDNVQTFGATIYTQAYDPLNPDMGVIDVNALMFQAMGLPDWTYTRASSPDASVHVDVEANGGGLSFNGIFANSYDVVSNTGVITFHKFISPTNGLNEAGHDVIFNSNPFFTNYVVEGNTGTVVFQIDRYYGAPFQVRIIFPFFTSIIPIPTRS